MGKGVVAEKEFVQQLGRIKGIKEDYGTNVDWLQLITLRQLERSLEESGLRGNLKLMARLVKIAREVQRDTSSEDAREMAKGLVKRFGWVTRVSKERVKK